MNKPVVLKISMFSVLAAMSLLVACTTDSLQLQNAGHPDRYDALAYYSWSTLASPDALHHELSRLEADVDNAGADESLVQLAVLVSAKTGDTQQQLRALHLLDEFELRTRHKSANPDYQSLAGLWRQVLEPRLHSHSLEERIASLELETSSLREQIEALTSIEQQLDQREQVRERSRATRAL